MLGLFLSVALVNARPFSREDLPMGNYELLQYDPVANLEAVVQSGAARFTVLTDRVIRMEYDPSQIFQDQATVSFLYRNTTISSFGSTTTNFIRTVATRILSLQYTVRTAFSPETRSFTS